MKKSLLAAAMTLVSVAAFADTPLKDLKSVPAEVFLPEKVTFVKGEDDGTGGIDFTVATDIAAGHLHELLPNRALNEAKPFYAVYYGDNSVSPKIRAFVDFLAERLGERQAGAT